MSQEPPASPPVVHGLGGTGKSTLALHFAHRSRDRYNPVWWISADSPVSVTRGLPSLPPGSNPYANLDRQDQRRGRRVGYRLASGHHGWLLRVR